MPQPTDLFRHTILIYVKSNLLISFNTLTRKYLGNMYPDMVSQWSMGIVSPPKVLKYGRNFFHKKLLMADEETNLFEQLYGGAAALHGELLVRSRQGRGTFTNPLSSNLKTVNLKISPNHEGIYP